VRVDAGRRENEPRMLRGKLGGAFSRRNRFTDAYHGDPTRLAEPLHGGVAIFVERRIAEMCVAVDERGGHTNENRRLRGGFFS
jgi:hypothetical protein